MDSLLINSSFNFSLSNPKTHFPNYYPFPISKLNSSIISLSYKPHQKPTLQCPPPKHTPFSSLMPIVKKIKHLAAKTTSSDQLFNGELVQQNGGIGMALLSVTSTAKVRISPFVATLAANPTFVSGFFAWVIAQSMKVFLHFYFERKWDFRILCASGGMPSSHSALCTALTTSVAICHGVADSLFPVCLGFSLIVMYDAIGVRRHAGMQAQVNFS